MHLGGIPDLIQALGGKVGETYAVALKSAAGLGGIRKFNIDAVVAWLQENPRFKISDVYHRRPTPPRPRNRPGRKAATVGKPDAP